MSSILVVARRTLSEIFPVLQKSVTFVVGISTENDTF